MSSQSVPHAKEVVPFILSLYMLPVLLLMAVAAANLKMGIPVGLFARDPASTANLHPFAGIMSNVGGYGMGFFSSNMLV